MIFCDIVCTKAMLTLGRSVLEVGYVKYSNAKSEGLKKGE
jgi:hypothetical protein